MMYEIQERLIINKIQKNIMNSLIDIKLTNLQQKIFNIFILAEEHRYGHKLSEFKNFKTIKSLISFCLLKSIWIFIPVVICADKLSIKTKIDVDNLYTIIKNQPFNEYYFKQYNKSFIKKKWYKNNKLPIIANIDNKNYIIDGNHRLVQQIYYNEIKYYYVTGDIGWKQYIKKIKILKQNEKKIRKI